MKIGDLVVADEIAFSSSSLDVKDFKSQAGIIVGKTLAREDLNLDTDDSLCEVFMVDGRVYFFYELDLKVINL
jgi:hypothetical protein